MMKGWSNEGYMLLWGLIFRLLSLVVLAMKASHKSSYDLFIDLLQLPLRPFAGLSGGGNKGNTALGRPPAL